MTDYKSLWLKCSPAPHVRAKEAVGGMMADVIIALMPALLFAVYRFGMRALLMVLVSVAGCVALEALSRFLMGRHQMLGDLSAVVTGMLIAFTCPVTTPYWELLIADFVAIVLVKQLYGGAGKNLLNPALAGRAALLVVERVMAYLSEADAVASATPMAYLHAGDLAGLQAVYSYADMAIGHIDGSIGEVSAMCLLLGFVWLVLQRVVRWMIPVSFVGTVALLTFLFPRGHEPLDWMLCHVLGGSLLLGAIFMATDCVTSPVSRRGQMLYGTLCGAITVLLRCFGPTSEGVTCAILTMNLLMWGIDKRMRPHRFGISRVALLRRLAAKLGQKENGGMAAVLKAKVSAACNTVKSRSAAANIAALFAPIRERLELMADPPRALQGVPIGILTALLVALALSGFVGINLW